MNWVLHLTLTVLTVLFSLSSGEIRSANNGWTPVIEAATDSGMKQPSIMIENQPSESNDDGVSVRTLGKSADNPPVNSPSKEASNSSTPDVANLEPMARSDERYFDDNDNGNDGDVMYFFQDQSSEPPEDVLEDPEEIRSQFNQLNSYEENDQQRLKVPKDEDDDNFGNGEFLEAVPAGSDGGNGDENDVAAREDSRKMKFVPVDKDHGVGMGQSSVRFHGYPHGKGPNSNSAEKEDVRHGPRLHKHINHGIRQLSEDLEPGTFEPSVDDVSKDYLRSSFVKYTTGLRVHDANQGLGGQHQSDNTEENEKPMAHHGHGHPMRGSNHQASEFQPMPAGRPVQNPSTIFQQAKGHLDESQLPVIWVLVHGRLVPMRILDPTMAMESHLLDANQHGGFLQQNNNDGSRFNKQFNKNRNAPVRGTMNGHGHHQKHGGFRERGNPENLAKEPAEHEESSGEYRTPKKEVPSLILLLPKKEGFEIGFSDEDPSETTPKNNQNMQKHGNKGNKFEEAAGTVQNIGKFPHFWPKRVKRETHEGHGHQRPNLPPRNKISNQIRKNNVKRKPFHGVNNQQQDFYDNYGVGPSNEEQENSPASFEGSGHSGNFNHGAHELTAEMVPQEVIESARIILQWLFSKGLVQLKDNDNHLSHFGTGQNHAPWQNHQTNNNPYFIPHDDVRHYSRSHQNPNLPLKQGSSSQEQGPMLAVWTGDVKDAEYLKHRYLAGFKRNWNFKDPISVENENPDDRNGIQGLLAVGDYAEGKSGPDEKDSQDATNELHKRLRRSLQSLISKLETSTEEKQRPRWSPKKAGRNKPAITRTNIKKLQAKEDIKDVSFDAEISTPKSSTTRKGAFGRIFKQSRTTATSADEGPTSPATVEKSPKEGTGATTTYLEPLYFTAPSATDAAGKSNTEPNYIPHPPYGSAKKGSGNKSPTQPGFWEDTLEKVPEEAVIAFLDSLVTNPLELDSDNPLASLLQLSLAKKLSKSVQHAKNTLSSQDQPSTIADGPTVTSSPYFDQAKLYKNTVSTDSTYSTTQTPTGPFVGTSSAELEPTTAGWTPMLETEGQQYPVTVTQPSFRQPSRVQNRPNGGGNPRGHQNGLQGQGHVRPFGGSQLAKEWESYNIASNSPGGPKEYQNSNSATPSTNGNYGQGNKYGEDQRQSYGQGNVGEGQSQPPVGGYRNWWDRLGVSLKYF